MRQLPLTHEFKKVSREVIWFEPPEIALLQPIRFIAYAMTYGSHEAMQQIRQFYSDQELLEALNQAPPGIFDGRSWAYWNLMLDRYPAPALPERKFGIAK